MQLATNPAQSHVMLRRRKNVWYSLQDGNWSDPNTWISNALDKMNHTSPQVGDDVYINHSVALTLPFAHPQAIPNTATVNNLYVSGALSVASSAVLIVNGNCWSVGTIDISASTSTIQLNGVTNFIGTFLSNTNSTVIYGGINDQDILNLSYGVLQLNGQPKTYRQISNITCNSLNCSIVTNTIGANIAGGGYNLNGFNLTVNTTSTFAFANGVVTNSGGASTLLFKGLCTVSTSSFIFNLNTADAMEFRGGLSSVNMGCSTNAFAINFTTASQSVSFGGGMVFDFYGTMTIASGITITQSGGGTLQIRNILNGLSGTSTWDNRGVLYIAGTTQPMTTGSLLITNGANTLGYSMASPLTLWYSSYWSLAIVASGTKTLLSDTTLSGNLTLINTNSYLDTSTYNLTVNGTTNLNGAASTIFKATSTGLCLFIGQFTSSTSSAFLDLADNAVAEFRGGINTVNLKSTTGKPLWKFTTNNQSLTFNNFSLGHLGNWLISGNITVINNVSNVLNALSGTLDGDSSGSIFDNRASFSYNNATAPMATGKLYCNQAANTFIYGLAGNQDIQPPSDPTPGYKNLTLNGSGAKRLLGNVSVKGTYTLTGPATLNSNGFALTNP